MSEELIEVDLRAEWDADVNVANDACMVWQWLEKQTPANRAFLVERLESRVGADSLKDWLARRRIAAPGTTKLNSHRGRRCTCPDEYPGRRADD